MTRKSKVGRRKYALLFWIGILASSLSIMVFNEKKKIQQTSSMKRQVRQLRDQKSQSPDDEEEIEEVLSQYQAIYEENNDFIGWLTIKDTTIDYPVMQTIEDETYYLYRGFDQEENINGCLIMDTDSIPGETTNMMIHGHNMKSGEMFGGLKHFIDEAYYKEHNKIYFDTLNEEQEYEIISVFYDQVYKKSDEVFKYYHFQDAKTQEAFDSFYNYIKDKALFDTGITAEFGDEFITLSTCSSHIENGRLVVVGKRVAK